MLYKPINAYPSNGVSIDAEKENVFSTIIQGASSVVTGYRVILYDADTLEEVETSDKFDLTVPLTAGKELSFKIREDAYVDLNNGRSYFWKLRLYQYAPDIFITNSEVQEDTTTAEIVIREHYNVSPEMYISVNGVQKKITEISINDNSTSTLTLESAFDDRVVKGTQVKIHSNFVDSIQFGFCTNKTPILKMNGEPPQTISSRSYNFVMCFEGEIVPIKWHRFILSSIDDNTSEAVVVEDTGYVYSSDMSFNFEGFVNDKTYILSCSAETTAGVIVNSDGYGFVIKYTKSDLHTKLNITNTPDEQVVKISWLPGDFSEGKISEGGEYHFVNNKPFDGAISLSVDKGYVYWDTIDNNPLALENSYGLMTYIIINTDINGDIIVLESDDGEDLSVYSDGLRIYTRNEKGFMGNGIYIYGEEKDGLQIEPTVLLNTAYLCDKNGTVHDKKDYYCVKSRVGKRDYRIAIIDDEVEITPLNPEVYYDV